MISQEKDEGGKSLHMFFFKKGKACTVGAAKYCSLSLSIHELGSPKESKLHSTQCQVLWDGTKFTKDMYTRTLVLSM